MACSVTERIIVTMLLMVFTTHLKLLLTALTGVAVSSVLDRGLALSSDLACQLTPQFLLADFRSHICPLNDAWVGDPSANTASVAST